MLQHSFIFLPGVGQSSEQKLWQSGILDWNDFSSAKKLVGFSNIRKLAAESKLKEFESRMLDDDLLYLSDNIPHQHHWRLYDHLKNDALFLDIETDGFYGNITVLGLYDGNETKTLVRGFNLDKHIFQKALDQSKVIVTFNGSSFDLPIVSRFFGIKINKPHIDLRHVCSKIGLTGGLKAIEHEVGIRRSGEIEGVSGADAVALWQNYRSSGEESYLKRLIAYNEADIINLKPLADMAIKGLWKNVFHKSLDHSDQPNQRFKGQPNKKN